LDSLESHLAAVLEHAKTASPGATKVIAGFADTVLDRLEDWGVELRGTLESYRAKVAEVTGFNAEANTNTVVTSSGIGSSDTNRGVQGWGATNPTPTTDGKAGTVGSGIGSGG